MTIKTLGLIIGLIAIAFVPGADSNIATPTIEDMKYMP
jgi:hypothetical protein